MKRIALALLLTAAAAHADVNPFAKYDDSTPLTPGQIAGEEKANADFYDSRALFASVCKDSHDPTFCEHQLQSAAHVAFIQGGIASSCNVSHLDPKSYECAYARTYSIKNTDELLHPSASK
ncbi:hypothetical protein NRB36_004328 [Salmonella enterica]|nr:hypothetical protein [Salmonella enterica]EJO1639687.1 hypothetical protein [Salmonella enterica]